MVRLGCGTDAVISSAFLGDFCTPVCEERRAGVAVFSSGWGLAFTGLDIGAAVCAARRESLRPVSSEVFFWTASSAFLGAAVFGVLTATFAARGGGRLGFVITGGLGGLAATRGDALRLGATSCGAGGLAVTRGAIEGCFFASPCVRCRPSGRVRGASVVLCTRGRDASCPRRSGAFTALMTSSVGRTAPTFAVALVFAARAFWVTAGSAGADVSSGGSS